jgi:hypothetical protein
VIRKKTKNFVIVLILAAKRVSVANVLDTTMIWENYLPVIFPMTLKEAMTVRLKILSEYMRNAGIGGINKYNQ